MKGILTSRKFWAAGIGLLVIIITAFLPGFPAIQQPLTDVTLLVSAYILGTAVEGQRLPVGSAIQGLIHSRKFWAGTAGLIVILLRAALPDLPLEDEQLTAIIVTLSAYIFGTGAQDGLANLGASWLESDKENSHA
jgi:hypothetical protein